jgi:hypothetical protein
MFVWDRWPSQFRSRRHDIDAKLFGAREIPAVVSDDAVRIRLHGQFEHQIVTRIPQKWTPEIKDDAPRRCGAGAVCSPTTTSAPARSAASSGRRVRRAPACRPAEAHRRRYASRGPLHLLRGLACVRARQVEAGQLHADVRLLDSTGCSAWPRSGFGFARMRIASVASATGRSPP